MYLFKSFLLLYVYNYAWINAFSSRGGGSRLSRQKIKTFDNVFITFYFTLVLNLFSVILRGVQLFPGEVGVKTYFYRKL